MRLAGLVDTKSNHMRVNHAEIERCQEQVGVSQGNEHRPVDLLLALVNLASGLEGVTLVRSSNGERGVGQVELCNPSDEGRSASSSTWSGDVAVVGSHRLAWCIPEKTNLLASEGQRLRSVVCNGTAHE